MVYQNLDSHYFLTMKSTPDNTVESKIACRVLFKFGKPTSAGLNLSAGVSFNPIFSNLHSTMELRKTEK